MNGSGKLVIAAMLAPFCANNEAVGKIYLPVTNQGIQISSNCFGIQ